MSLPLSGQISIRDINVEVGRSSTAANTSLASLENGTYITINTISTYKPNGSNPNSVREWLGYNHNAVVYYSYTIGVGNTTGDTCNDYLNGNTIIYSDSSTFQIGMYLYTDTNLTNLISQSYATDPSGNVYNVASGYVSSSAGTSC